MKRSFVVVLSWVMAAGLLAGCGVIATLPGGAGGPADPPESSAVPGDANPPDASGDPGSTGGGSGGTSGIPYSRDYVDQHLTGDFSIRFDVASGPSASLSMAMMRTSEGYYFDLSGAETLYIKNGDAYDVYQGAAGHFAQVGQAAQADVDEGMSSILDSMVMYDTADIHLKKAGTETVAGRDCDKLSASVSVLGKQASATFWVDKATGVCMKYEVIDATGSLVQSLAYVVTEFKTSNVTLPAHG